jgi:hypothetical protein
MGTRKICPCFYCCSCCKIMNLNGEIIVVLLEVEFSTSISNLPSTSTSHVDNSTSTNHLELWVLLTKNQDF